MIKQVIQNFKSPICQTCKYYKPFSIFGHKDNYEYSRCMKFGEKNIITGELKFEFAKNIRRDGNKCGPNGTLYEEKKWTIF